MIDPFLPDCLSYKENELIIDEINIKELVKKTPTPFYAYSLNEITKNIEELNQALRNNLDDTARYTICYATKALNNISVIKHIAKHGCGADIVSGGELIRALRGDMPHNKIVFSGVGKTDEEIKYAINANIKQINVESGAELKRIEAIAKQENAVAPVVFRLNPDVKAGAHEKISTGQKEDKFGLSAAAIETLYDFAAKSEYLSPKGISLHIGSQLIDMSPFATAYEIAADFVNQLRANGHAPETIDLGGGIGIIYGDEDKPNLDAYAKIVRQYIEPLGLEMIFEPGRSLVGNAGILVSKILYIKQADHKDFIVLDASMSELLRPALYDAIHQIIPVKQPQDKNIQTKPFDVVGPVCESADVFAKNLDMPAALQAGDYVAFTGAGAYGAVMSSSYNARPLPAEWAINGEYSQLIRKAISTEDLLKFEDPME